MSTTSTLMKAVKEYELAREALRKEELLARLAVMKEKSLKATQSRASELAKECAKLAQVEKDFKEYGAMIQTVKVHTYFGWTQLSRYVRRGETATYVNNVPVFHINQTGKYGDESK